MRPAATSTAPVTATLRLRRVAGALSLAALTALAGTACKSDDAPTLPARGAIPDSADQVMYGLRHYVWNGGLRRAQLLADTAFFYDDNNRIELRRLKTIFYTATGDSNAVMTGERGTYDVRTQMLDGRGNVLVTSVDGRRLASPHLVWERGINQITSDTSFTFTGPGCALSGIGLRTNPALTNLQVERAARGRAAPGSRCAGVQR